MLREIGVLRLLVQIPPAFSPQKQVHVDGKHFDPPGAGSHHRKLSCKADFPPFLWVSFLIGMETKVEASELFRKCIFSANGKVDLLLDGQARFVSIICQWPLSRCECGSAKDWLLVNGNWEHGVTGMARKVQNASGQSRPLQLPDRSWSFLRVPSCLSR